MLDMNSLSYNGFSYHMWKALTLTLSLQTKKENMLQDKDQQNSMYLIVHLWLIQWLKNSKGSTHKSYTFIKHWSWFQPTNENEARCCLSQHILDIRVHVGYFPLVEIHFFLWAKTPPQKKSTI
jgi:hypothetical protein